MMGSKRRAIIDIEFSGKSPCDQCMLQSAEIALNPFGEKKRRMRDQSGMVIYEGYQIGFSELIFMLYLGTMHDITLPEIVGKICFKFAPVRGSRANTVHQLPLVQKPVNGCWAQMCTWGDEVSLSEGFNQFMNRRLGLGLSFLNWIRF